MNQFAEPKLQLMFTGRRKQEKDEKTQLKDFNQNKRMLKLS